MKRTGSTRLGPGARFLVQLLVTALVAGLSTASYAGLSGMVRSAKDKATQAPGQKPAQAQKGAPPKFDDTTLELNGELLDRLIACRKAANEVTNDRKKLVARGDQIQKELNDLQEKNHDAIVANTNKRGEIQNCREVAFHDLQGRKMMQMQQRAASDPQLIQKITTLSTETSQAYAAGDTAKAARLQQQLFQLAGYTRADTAAIDKSCGVVPPVHPAQVKIDALNQEWNDGMASVRAMDLKAIQVQKEQCGMNEEQLGMAWDRIQKFLAGTQEFTDVERKALTERKDILATLAS